MRIKNAGDVNTAFLCLCLGYNLYFMVPFTFLCDYRILIDTSLLWLNYLS